MGPLTRFADVYQGLARAGRGAGVRQGPWHLRIVESGDVREDGWLVLRDLREISVEPNARTGRHLLRPFDVLVTARAASTHVALVPPGVSLTVAGVTMLVVRPKQRDLGMGHWLWLFLTSIHGRVQLSKRLNVNATVISLSARNLGEIEVPLPPQRELDAVVRLVEASEAAYTASLEAARLRRDVLRDAIVAEVGRRSGQAS